MCADLQLFFGKVLAFLQVPVVYRAAGLALCPLQQLGSAASPPQQDSGGGGVRWLVAVEATNSSHSMVSSSSNAGGGGMNAADPLSVPELRKLAASGPAAAAGELRATSGLSTAEVRRLCELASPVQETELGHIPPTMTPPTRNGQPAVSWGSVQLRTFPADVLIGAEGGRSTPGSVRSSATYNHA